MKDIAAGDVSTFDWLSKQQTKTNSSWHEEAKKAQDAKELKECTFAPQITQRRTNTTNAGGKVTTAKVAISIAGTTAPANERLYKMRKSQKDKTDKSKEDFEFEK